MKELTAHECCFICGTSNCPDCHEFMEVHTTHGEPGIITTTGKCDKCNMTFMVDRSYTVPYKVLGGHKYTEADK